MGDNTLINMKIWLDKHINTIFLCFGVIASLSVLIINFLSLKNNLIFSDEGWYLCLLRDIPHFGSSRFHLLFNNVFQNNIYLIRVFCWFLLLVGSIVLSLGIASFIKSGTHKSPYLFLWSFISVMFGQMYIHDCPSLNYITLNIVIAELSVGCLLLGLSKEKCVYYLLSGSIISALFPIMITNVVFIPIMCIAIFLLSNFRWKNCGVFVLGVVLFLLLYFAFIEKPIVVWEFIKKESGNVIARGGEQYGLTFFIRWLIDTILFFTKLIIMAIAMCATYYFLTRHTFIYACCNKWKVLIGWIITIYVFIFFHHFVSISTIEKTSSATFFLNLLGYKYLYWLLLFALILISFVKQYIRDSKRWLIYWFFLVIPVCLSFGTNVPFYIRGMTYLMFITPIIINLYHYQDFNLKIMVFMILIFLFTSYMIHSINGNNWHGESYFGTKTPVTTIGINQNICLDSYYLNKLQTCRTIIPNKEYVICSKQQWGVVNLLDYKPITYEFDVMRLDSITFSKIVNDQLDKNGYLWAISDEYSQSFNERIESLTNNKIQVNPIIAGDNRCYLLKK